MKARCLTINKGQALFLCIITAMQTNFLYHRVVPNMVGTILYPLNELKNSYPISYAEHVKKYVGREQLLDTRIPILNCLWNDVIHFTAVSPHELSSNLAKGGVEPKEIVWKKWFKIPAEMLDPKNIVVCVYRRDKSVIPEARDFSTFDLKKMKEYRTVGSETITYYKEQNALGRRPLLFHRVPHILFKGTVDTEKLEIIEM